MQFPRLLALVGGLITALAVGPMLGAAALAADPTVVVRPGDTLTGISKRHGVTVADLVRLNVISDPNRVYAGQTLRLASAPAADAPAPVHAAPAEAPAVAQVHVVGLGENLTTIARYYRVTVAAIVAANGIGNPNRIFGGQQLSIPRSVPAAEAPAPVPAAPAATATPMPSAMAAAVSRRDAVRQVIVEEAARYGVPAAFALAVAWQESGWQQGVVSRAGAVGVMQLIPATATWVAESMLGTPVNIHDERDNVRAGVRLLAHYFARYAGNRDLVLAAYYQGQAAADRHGVYNISRQYITSILVLERLFGG